MMNKLKKRLNIREMVALLENKQFCADALRVIDKDPRRNERPSTQRARDRKWPAFCRKEVLPFIRKWGALPPSSLELVDKDPRQKIVFAILTGGWGFIPIFPWTSQKEIDERAAKIRKAIGKTHKDASEEQRALKAKWLRLHENPGDPKQPSRSEIASVVWGRRTGLRRLSTAQAIKRLPEDRETELLQRYMSQGSSWDQAERKLIRRARGSESPASATVRMAEKRLTQKKKKFQAELETPHCYDKSTYYLTLLFREIILSKSPTLRATREKVLLLRDQLLTTSS